MWDVAIIRHRWHRNHHHHHPSSSYFLVYFSSPPSCFRATLSSSFYTQGFFLTNVFAQGSFYIEKLLHREPLPQMIWATSQIAISPPFLPFDLHFERTGCIWDVKTATLPLFLTLDLRFARKGCIWDFKIRILHPFWRLTLISCERVASDLSKLQFYIRFLTCPFDAAKSRRYISFCRSTFISCERVAPAVWKSQLYLFVTFDLHFARQGSAITQQNRTIPAEGWVPATHRISPHVCAPDTPDLRSRVACHHTFVRRRRRTSDSHFTTRLCVRHALSQQRVTFRKPVFGCPAALRENVEELEK